MQRIHTFIRDSIVQGHTVLVYKRSSKVKHVKSMDRVSMVDGVVFVDGVSTVGKTICLKS